MDEEEFDLKCLELYKESYEFELSRKEQLAGKVSLLIGIMTILSGFIVHYLSVFPLLGFDFGSLIFMMPYLAGVICTVITFCCLNSFLKTRDYDYIPAANEIRAAIAAAKDGKAEDLSTQVFENLANEYVSSAAKNFQNNKERIACFNGALKFALYSTMLLAVTAPGFFYLQWTKPEAVPRVEVVNELEVKWPKNPNPKQTP
jgi:hypothetical protein